VPIAQGDDRVVAVTASALKAAAGLAVAPAAR
jgi:hypothetical protein